MHNARARARARAHCQWAYRYNVMTTFIFFIFFLLFVFLYFLFATTNWGRICMWVRARQLYFCSLRRTVDIYFPRTILLSTHTHTQTETNIQQPFQTVNSVLSYRFSAHFALGVLGVLGWSKKSKQKQKPPVLYLERLQCIISFVALFNKSVISNSMINKVIIESWTQSLLTLMCVVCVYIVSIMCMQHTL